MRSNFEFNSFDEVMVKGYMWQQTEVKSRCVLVKAHGMAESILRYERFADFLNANGIIVYGHSQRGHGETAQSTEKLGYIGKDGWNRMVEDLKTVVDKAHEEFPDLPVVIFGHSMGSFIARDFIMKYGASIDALVLSGTGYAKQIELQAANLIAKFEGFIRTDDLPSNRLDKLSFGKFNAQIANAKTPFDWLSRDEIEVKAYIDNPYCGQVHPTSFFVDFTQNLLKILYSKTTKFEAPFFPILLISGEKDPVGDFGKGVIQSAEYYKKNRFPVEVKLYPDARHELLNELNRMDVYEDILTWLNKIIEK